FGGKSLAPVLKLPGIPTKATFIVGPDTGADTNHSITSLIRPVGAAIMDQTAGFVGTREYEFTEPGLYAFTCKIHPYMLGAAAVGVENWTVSQTVALPRVNLNNHHNMWTDKDQRVIYQTEWFSEQLDVFDRETLQLLRRVQVGNAPSHVMTRTDTDQLHVAL